MKRLTGRDEKGNLTVEGSYYETAFCLEKYENTDLTPKQIMELKERDAIMFTDCLKNKIRKKLERTRKGGPMSRREEGYEEALLVVLSMIHELENKN